MYTKEGKNRAGERIALDVQEGSYRVIWFGCFGHDMAELSVESAEEAEKLYDDVQLEQFAIATRKCDYCGVNKAPKKDENGEHVCSECLAKSEEEQS